MAERCSVERGSSIADARSMLRSCAAVVLAPPLRHHYLSFIAKLCLTTAQMLDLDASFDQLEDYGPCISENGLIDNIISTPQRVSQRVPLEQTPTNGSSRRKEGTC